MRRSIQILAGAGLAAALACGGGESAPEGTLSGPVEIDGSSTVYPISEAVAEEFQIANPETRVAVGVSGTGGGFKRFCAGETDVSNASRPIDDEEAAACEQNGVRFTEVRVAWDGLSVVTNPSNDFVQCLTIDELKRIWEPGSTIDNWSQVRSGFPNKNLVLYGPGTDSGTFDYFTESVVGETDASRPDYTASEDDNVLVQGVQGDPGALGYFGFAYYEENADRLKLLGVDGGTGCIQPSVQTIESQTYAPLSRPLFIYVSDVGLAKPQVEAFVEFHLQEGAELVRSVGYIPLQPEQYADELAKVRQLAGRAAETAPAGEDTTAAQ
ncbi:MAG TPA: PstS family phosphate ABC transporter substrate-binding protein [Gemmatimonadota bacterium]|jgi:phosphate transport system substrate-binding protein|nr:PstS family phosphate ABC transporter substrate-binding protein [Gemmatimonadota bacterium]